ncbi:MAG: tetratricopeptide repeat protein [Anaerolineaceae bacterium]|nr:MAG: tetratricopeptide repeat protein [Anaerolineaceae bacterium]
MGLDLEDVPGEARKAKAAFERALAIDEQVYGPVYPNVAIRINNLGGVLRGLGDNPAAKPAFERALAIREKSIGPEHPLTVTSRENLEELERIMQNEDR